jgi:hypothetical protein
MGYEIDFLPVGEGEKSGDAIALRFGNLFGNRNEKTVVVIDGGFKETGEKLVKHIEVPRSAGLLAMTLLFFCIIQVIFGTSH